MVGNTADQGFQCLATLEIWLSAVGNTEPNKLATLLQLGNVTVFVLVAIVTRKFTIHVLVTVANVGNFCIYLWETLLQC